jgi:hemerythrin-like domain-containing protein
VTHTSPDTPGASEGDAPIESFSQCHVGIVKHLQELGRLPALLEPAAQARRIADETVKFFRDVIYDHHAQEERELFPAVLTWAAKGEERDKVQEIVDRLVREHREVEAAWSKLEPELKAVAKGHDADLDPAAVAALVGTYEAHAKFEEDEFLPLSQTILGRDSKHMAALGLSLHMRHAVQEVLDRFGFRA